MRLGALVAMFAAALVVTSGCGGPPAESSGGRPALEPTEPANPASADRHAVDWTNSYCVAVAGLVDAISVAPRVDPSTPQRAAATSIELLAGVIDGLNGIVHRLDGLEPSQVPGGDEVAGTAIGTFIGIRDRAQDAQGQLSAAPAGTDQSREALGVTGAVLDEVGRVDLLGGVNSIPRLAESSRDAPACKDLTRSEPSPRMGTTPDPAQTRTR
ncbi:MAG: hypothetical protein ACRDQ7_11055 [Haloechinothrix sp.]